MKEKTNYALVLLKQERTNILDKLVYLEILEVEGKEVNKNAKPLYKEQLASIEKGIYALELIESTKGIAANHNIYKSKLAGTR